MNAAVIVEIVVIGRPDLDEGSDAETAVVVAGEDPITVRAGRPGREVVEGRIHSEMVDVEIVRVEPFALDSHPDEGGIVRKGPGHGDRPVGIARGADRRHRIGPREGQKQERVPHDTCSVP